MVRWVSKSHLFISGGLEMLFNNEKKIEVKIAGGSNVSDLIKYLCQEVIKDSRKELFVLGDTVYVCCLPYQMLVI
jgi:hypothetical protein